MKAAAVDEFVARANALLVQPTQREAGCVRYTLVQDLGDPSRFAMHETWTSAEALAIHLAQPALAAARDQLRPLIAAAPVVEKYRSASN